MYWAFTYYMCGVLSSITRNVPGLQPSNSQVNLPGKPDLTGQLFKCFGESYFVLWSMISPKQPAYIINGISWKVHLGVWLLGLAWAMSVPTVGQRRSFDGHLCTIRYVGTVQGTSGDWLGVEWDDGRNDRRWPTVGTLIAQARPNRSIVQVFWWELLCTVIHDILTKTLEQLTC
jgi:hypothetical protein